MNNQKQEKNTDSQIIEFDYKQGGKDWGKFYDQEKANSQSPIKIVTSQVTEHTLIPIRSLKFNSQKQKTNIDFQQALLTQGNFSSVKIEIENHLVNYKSLQFHIHSPAEHQIDNFKGDIELHIVHNVKKDEQNLARKYKLLVIGIIFKAVEGKDNEFLNEWLDDKNHDKNFKLDLSYFQKLFDQQKLNNYYQYLGSLTIPRCDQIVKWYVFEEPIEVSHRQLDRIKKLMSQRSNFDCVHGNCRQLQPLCGRVVRKGCLSSDINQKKQNF